MKRIALWIVALAILAAPTWAVEPTLLPHNSPVPGEEFGFDGARCDGLSFVGRQYDASAGSVAVFRGLVLVDEVFYPGAQTNARFGHTLDVTHDCRRLVVCAPDDDSEATNAGACFVFDRTPGTDEYVYVASLSGADSAAGDELGQSVAISSDGYNIAAGAIAFNNYQGKVYVWWESGPSWGEKKLSFSDLQVGDWGGFALTFVFNSWLIATAPLDFNSGSPSWEGSFYLFDRNAGGVNFWGQKFKGTIPDSYKLGWDVSASGRRVALGAPGDAGFPSDDASGDVYTILINGDGNGWTNEQHITAPAPQSEAEFGASVGLTANQLTVGERWRSIDGVEGAGRWYVFLKPAETPWTLSTEITPSNASDYDRNGWSSDIYGGWFLGGAPFSNVDGADAGAGYVHVLDSIFADGFELGGTGVWSKTTP